MHPQFHAEGVCTLSAGVADIFKRRLLALCSDLLECRKFQYIQDLATIDALRDIDYPSCAYLVRLLRICICAHAYLNYVAREYIYIRRGLRVVSSNVQGNATASIGGTGKCKFHAFFISFYKINKTHQR